MPAVVGRTFLAVSKQTGAPSVLAALLSDITCCEDYNMILDAVPFATTRYSPLSNPLIIESLPR